LAPAIVAAAEELDAVPLDPEFRSTSQAAGQSLQPTIREFDYETAPIADQVMPVITIGAGVVSVSVFHMDVFNKVQPGQQVHGPVHTGQTHPRVNGLRAPVHLGHLEVLLRCGQDLQDCLSAPGQLQPLFLQRLSEMSCGHEGSPN
jgi:hypothetical protein